MNDMNRAIADLKGMSASIKLARLLEKVPEEKMAETMQEVMQTTQGLEDFKTRLDAFRKEVGDEHYKILASGPNFNAVLNQWLEEKKQKTLELALEGIRLLLPENADITDEEIKYALWHMKQAS